ncbi:hypothetical protein ACPRNU_24275 [Chromobacterium vaccinii]|uniref:hypothetical protein n=1 Tax=Chromobacterium vaccinii TaxID=1108595 RepID=UPI003C773833
MAIKTLLAATCLLALSPPAAVAEPLAQRQRAEDQATGRGYVFDPDPLSSTRARYGDPGYVNNRDRDSPQLKAARVQVPLPGLGQDIDGKYQLVGPWAHCVAATGYDSCPHETAPVFEYTRDQPAFGAVNAYFHIDRMMRYVNRTLGLAIHPYQYAGGVRYDPHGLRVVDPKDGKTHTEANARYVREEGRIQFGGGSAHGAVSDEPDSPDFAEDGLVVIHELGHGLHDWVTHGAPADYEYEGLGEGVGDYFAAGYARDHGRWRPGDPEYHQVAVWAGEKRASDWHIGRRYPADVVNAGNEAHVAGQYWSSCNMVARDAIGGPAMDRAMLVGLAMTGRHTRQDQAAQAVLKAAEALHYTAAQLDGIRRAYTKSCSYGVAGSPPPAEIGGAAPGRQMGCDYLLDLDAADPQWTASVPLKDGDAGRDLRLELDWTPLSRLRLGGPAIEMAWPRLSPGKASWDLTPLAKIAGAGRKLILSYTRDDGRMRSQPLALCLEGKTHSLPAAYFAASPFVGRLAVDVGNYVNASGALRVQLEDNRQPGEPAAAGELQLAIVDPQSRQTIHQYHASFRQDRKVPGLAVPVFRIDIPYADIGPYSGKLLRLSYRIGEARSPVATYPIIGRMASPGLPPPTFANIDHPDAGEIGTGAKIDRLQPGDEVALHWEIVGQKPIVMTQTYSGPTGGQLRFAAPPLAKNHVTRWDRAVYAYSRLRTYYEIRRQGRTLLSPSQDLMVLIDRVPVTTSWQSP